MAETNKDKSFSSSDKKLTRHEKSIEDRQKRQATALRTNLKKRKDQKRKRRISN